MSKKTIQPSSLGTLLSSITNSSREFTQALKWFYKTNHISDGKYGITWDKPSTERIFEVAEWYIQSPDTTDETRYNAYRAIGAIVWFNEYLFPYFERLLVLIESGITHPYGNIRVTVGHILGDFHMFFDVPYRRKITKAIQERRKIGYKFYAKILERHDAYEYANRHTLDEDDLTLYRQYTPWSWDTHDKILKSYRNVLGQLTRGIWLEEYLAEHEIAYYMDGWLLRLGLHKNLESMKQYLAGQIDKSVMDGFFALLCSDDLCYSPERATYWIEKNIADHITKRSIVEIAREESLEALTQLEKCLQIPRLDPTLREWIRMGMLYIEKIGIPMNTPANEDASDADFHIFSALGEFGWLPRYIIGVEMIDVQEFQKKSDIENINAYYILRDIPTCIESIDIHGTLARISLGVSYDIAVDTALDALFFYYNIPTKCVKQKCIVTNTDIPTWDDIKENIRYLPEKTEVR
jgi:hypothetical protein